MEVGVRVVRGPDWKWANQDDGEGHVGTVVEVGKPGSQSTPDKTVVVQWDSGSRTNYRIGYQGSYDLRILDNAPIGVRHPNIICNSCKKHGVAGMRWKCLVCANYDMCTSCYMADKHDLNHAFLRFEASNSMGVEMLKRSHKNSVKIQSRGIYVGARVVRGYDWDWGQQDGGEGKVGKVIDIRGWDNESRRSVANVMWASGSTNVYRLGHKGKVDLKYVIDSPGGHYYRDHLPIVGQPSPQEPPSARRNEIRGASALPSSSSLQASQSCPYNVGDKVKVVVEDEDELKTLQEGHGGWNPRMAQFIGQVGNVHRVTDRGDIRVQFEGCHNRWTFNPEGLVKVTSFSLQDIVRIIDDAAKVKELQKSHGEWIEQMRGALGKMGKVVKVYADGDLRVTVDGSTWTFNPLCVTMLPGSMLEMNNTMVHHQQQREDINPRLGHLLNDNHQQSEVMQQAIHSPLPSSFSQATSHCVGKEAIVREAAQGRLDVVVELLTRNPESVDCKSSGKTALQVASHQGHLDIVKVLLSAGAALDLKDDDGDTALHYAAFGNKSDVIETLLKKGANIDAVNKTKCSPLHIAVNKGHINCVKILIRGNCNVNLQDSYGDTALHDAIGKTSVVGTGSQSHQHSNNGNVANSTPAGAPSNGAGPSSAATAHSDAVNNEIVELLVAAPRVDLTIKNKRGFNCLHHACLKGNVRATECLIGRSRQLVDIKKEDGFSALHLAALNGHYSVAETLITSGKANINIINNRKQTPLHLSVSQSHCAIIELLVSQGANCNALDEDNDTSLHISLFKWSEQLKPDAFSHENCPAISDMLAQLANIRHDRSVNLAISCYLIQEGNADVNIRNRTGKTPLDLLEPGSGSLGSVPSSAGSTSMIKEYLLNMLEVRNEQQQQRAVQQQELEQDVIDLEDGMSALKIGSVIPMDLINDIECLICNENFANVQFSPCFHQVCCTDCCVKMKKCIICQQQIQKKIVFSRDTGHILNVIDSCLVSNIRKDSKGNSEGLHESKVQKSELIQKLMVGDGPQSAGGASSLGSGCQVERLRYLESKIAEIEDANCCSICMERVRNVVFLCGHGACVNCAQTLKTCHMCRKTITKKINMY